MKTVGDKLEKFAVTGIRPGQPEDAFYTITEKSFEGKFVLTADFEIEIEKQLVYSKVQVS